MPLFQSRSKRQRRAQDAARQKEREQRYRQERDEWRRVAKKVRDFASRRYLRGQGIEIGGLYKPLTLYEGAKVKYVDRLSEDEMRRWLSSEEVRRRHPDLVDQPRVSVDIVDDGETLRSIADGSLDFVIANHMIEHTHNPIATVETFLRVLKPGGIIFMAIPDKRYTFDRKREVTPFAHIREDYLRGPEWSARGHYEDWARNVREFADEDGARNVREFADEEAISRYVEKAVAERENIHFHVWTQTEMLEMFIAMRREFAFPLEIEAAIQNGYEVVMVLRKSGGRQPAEGTPMGGGSETDDEPKREKS